jgi:hypothetical protein
VASADAQIRIVVNNMRALDKLSNNLNKLVKVNQVLVKSINKLETRLSKVTSKGFDDLGKGATTASQNISKTTASLTKFQKIQSTVIKTGLGAGGSIAGGIAGSSLIINRSINDINKLGNVFGITLIKANGLQVAISALKGALATGGGVGIGVALAGVIAALGKGAKDSYKLGQNLRDLTNKAGLTFKPINQDLDFTVKKFEKLNVQASNFVNLLRVMNPGSKGNVLRNTLRSQAGRAGTGFGRFSSAASQVTPMMSRGAGYGRGSGLDVSEQAMFGISTRYSTGRIGPMHPSEYYAKQASPLLGKYDAATSKSIARHTKHLAKINKATSKTAAILAGQQAMAAVPNAAQYGQSIGPQQSLYNRLGFGAAANPKGMFASRGGLGGRMRGAGSSAMIGGMFPLLFGQGGASAAGGGLGGLAGGALGGGLGFGLSLLGTVIGTKIQEAKDFRTEIDKLNISIKSTGGTSTFTAQSIKEFGKNLGLTKDEALQAARSFAQFDAAARVALTKTFGNEEVFNTLAALKDNQTTLEAIKSLSTNIGIEKTKETLEILKQKGLLEAQLSLVKEITTAERSRQIQQASKITFADRRNALADEMGVDAQGRSGAAQLRDARVEKLIENFAQADAKARKLLDSTKELNKEFEKISKLKAPEDELAKLLDSTNQLVGAATAIGDAFSSSFKGIISGSMSAQQALANFFQRTADHFLDMAAQIFAAQIKIGFIKMFTGAMAGGIGTAQTGIPSGANLPAGSFGTGTAGGVGKTANDLTRHFASGGYVTRPTVGLVGEAGEDEYVIPASKMASSMQRYSAGARGDSVIAGSGSSYSGGGAGGSTTVNYSGPILNFNSEEFVPKSAVGQIIATATARGAAVGESRTISSLRNSRSRRSSLGL